MHQRKGEYPNLIFQSITGKIRFFIFRFLSSLSSYCSVIRLPSKDPKCLQLLAFVDPLSEAAQKMAPLIEVLYKTTSINVTIMLNPVKKMTELPAKRCVSVYVCVVCVCACVRVSEYMHACVCVHVCARMRAHASTCKHMYKL